MKEMELLLDKKIQETIKYIKNLKQEKEKYQKELIDLKLELKTKNSEIKALKMKYAQTGQDPEKIKIKLKNVLRKIEDFELLNS